MTPTYRCYFLDHDDRIAGRAELTAQELSAAVDRALELLQDRPNAVPSRFGRGPSVCTLERFPVGAWLLSLRTLLA
jgi:hypothetical protein